MCDPITAADIYLGRQPILNRGRSLSAYEILFRDGVGNHAVVGDADHATAQVLTRTLGEFGVFNVLNGSLGFVNVGRGVLLSEFLETLPTDSFVIEILEDVDIDDAVLERCHALQKAGYRLALDDVSPDRQIPAALLEMIDIVKIDMLLTPPEELVELITFFKQRGKTVLAEKVETLEDFRRASNLGCDLFQGYFFARPEVLSLKKTGGSPTSLLRLLNLLNGDPSMQELEDALKLNPDIVVHVFRLANAAKLGARRHIDTLRDAILLVGTAQIARWVQLLVYAQGSDVPLQANPLVQLVGARARFMELAADVIGESEAGKHGFVSSACLVGVLSLMHVMFQITCSDLLDQLQINEPIRAAIERREGPLGALLVLAEAVEIQNETTLVQLGLRWPSLDRRAVAELQMNAARWVAQWVS